MSEYVATRLVHTDEGYTLTEGERRVIDPRRRHNARHITAGALVVAADSAPTKTELLERARELDIAGRSSMSADELSEAIKAAEAAPVNDEPAEAGEEND